MRLSDAALVVLIGLPGAQASHQPTITSILTELPDDLRGELPAKYAGIWRTRRFEVLARRESEGAMARRAQGQAREGANCTQPAERVCLYGQ